MFKKILVANRGEIALRVILPAASSVSRPSRCIRKPTKTPLHVRFADEDICIGPPRSAESYLNVPAIISAAEITGADAIHPGYGFLSESAYLAEVCEACHIRFIGPDPHVIRLLGDKAQGAPRDEEGRRPDAAGQRRPVESEDKALKVAQRNRLPVIIKAVAGGGGRGMRVVEGTRRSAARVTHGTARSRSGVRRRRRLHREIS
jgi:acetyl-CoA carboxylase biotin carboxylase subunit